MGSAQGSWSFVLSGLRTEFEGFRWHFEPTVDVHRRRDLESGAWLDSAELLKQNRRRRIYRVDGDLPLIVKHDCPPRPYDRLRAMFRRAGAREFAAAHAALAVGLPVPAPIGHAVRGCETLFAAEEIRGCTKLRLAWERGQTDARRRAALLRAVTDFAATFFRACMIHPDMHAGNILVREEADGSARCFLVDLAGARGLKPGRRFALWDAVGWLTHLAPRLRSREAVDILCSCGVAADAEEAWRQWAMLVRRTVTRWLADGRGDARVCLRPAACARSITPNRGIGL